MKIFCSRIRSILSERKTALKKAVLCLTAKIAGNGYFYDAIFLNCGYFNQNWNYEITLHVYLYKGKQSITAKWWYSFQGAVLGSKHI